MRTYLFDRRGELNLTVKMLEEIADISPQYICIFENGKRGKKVSFSVMSKLLDTINIPVERLNELELYYLKKRN